MRYSIAFAALPAVLAIPSPHDHFYRHHHHYHPSGASGAPSVSLAASTAPFGLSNSTAGPTASEAGTAAGTANSVYSTEYETLRSTVYQTATADSPSESAAADSICGGTVTVTNANTVYVTIGSGESAAASESAPQTQPSGTPSKASIVSTAAPSSSAPVEAASSAPVVSQSAISTPPSAKPVAPISEKPLSETPASQAATSQAPASQAASSQAPASQAASFQAPVSSAAASAVTSASPNQAGVPTSTPTLCPAASSAFAAASGTYSATPFPPGSKRGLFITETKGTSDDYVKAFNANPGNISWIVNQFSAPPAMNLSDAFTFVPQCYDDKSDDSIAGQAPHPWTTNAERAINAGEKYFLSFGEANTPNEQGIQQTAPQAADNFIKMLQPYADKVTIGSPGTLALCTDITWQIQILEECLARKCSIGFVAGHWFTPAGSASAQDLADTFYGTVNTYKMIAKKFGLRVWIDNFSINGPAAVQKEFFNIVLPQLDADDMIERYGYVSTTDVSQPDGFLNSDGSMSDLGNYYATR